MQEKNDFIEEIIDRIGLGGWQRVQDYLYETKYKEIISTLEKKRRADIRNIILFVLLCVCSVLIYNHFSTPADNESSSKTDYSPYSGWTYE
jgi:hypothetical protein